MKKILIGADPFAVGLKDSVAAHLKEAGWEVVDLGATPANAEKPYFETAADVARALQRGEAEKAVLLCGTGMGMSLIANRFKGVRAAVVESVFAAKMCRAINNANVLCLGQMIWGEWMANAAVDAFLETGFTQGLEALAPFLREAFAKCEAIDGK